VYINGDEVVVDAIITDNNSRLLLFVRKKIPQQDTYLLFLINDDEILGIPDISKSKDFQGAINNMGIFFNNLVENADQTIQKIKELLFK